MSTPILDILILIIPIIVSEAFKLRSKSIIMQQTRVGNGPTMLNLMRFDNPSMKEIMRFREMELNNNENKMNNNIQPKVTPAEIRADVVKWMTFSILTPSSSYVPLESAALVGAFCGLMSALFKGSDGIKKKSMNAMMKNMFLRLARATIEGSVQFFTYECSRQYLLGSP